MDIVPRQNDNIIILYLSGDINIDSSNFIEAVGYYLENGISDILCDFSNVSLVDYAGLSVLAIAQKNVANHHGRMKLVNVGAHIRTMLVTAALDKAFEIYEEENAALNSFKEDRIISEIKKKQLRRRFKRLQIIVPVEFRLKGYRDDAFHTGKIYNLSAIGAFIHAKKVYGLGDILSLNIKFSSKPGPLMLDAKVVWVAHREVTPHLYPGMGIEFYKISQQAQEQIFQFIERNLTLGAVAE